MNAFNEHKKYIMAMVAGAVVTAVLGLAIAYNVITVSSFNDRKEEALSFSHDIMTDKLEYYVYEVDNCKREHERMLKRESELISEYNTNLNYYRRRYNTLLEKCDNLQKELNERDTLLLETGQ